MITKAGGICLKKRALVFICVLLCMLLVAGCAGSVSKSIGHYEVWLDGEVIENDDKFVIRGKSNLIEGTRVTGQVIVSGDQVYSDTTEIVESRGRFLMELDHHQYGEAEIRIIVDFNNIQDEKVTRHYGEKGEKLVGPLVYKQSVWGDLYHKAQVVAYYDPDGDKSSITFEHPEWYELPEDYGDPRVWIEVDEITHDNNYFYLHGRSNLIEGSRIRGSYGWNSGEAYIKPDGSFDLKMDYEYLENTSFVIEFKPSNSQWQIVQEQYGANGQKLVGNAVTSSNNTQYVEIEVPLELSQ